MRGTHLNACVCSLFFFFDVFTFQIFKLTLEEGNYDLLCLIEEITEAH